VKLAKAEFNLKGLDWYCLLPNLKANFYFYFFKKKMTFAFFFFFFFPLALEDIYNFLVVWKNIVLIESFDDICRLSNISKCHSCIPLMLRPFKNNVTFKKSSLNQNLNSMVILKVTLFF
jgi:hypothetical protein